MCRVLMGVAIVVVQVSGTTRHTLFADVVEGDPSTSRRAAVDHALTLQLAFANVSSSSATRVKW